MFHSRHCESTIVCEKEKVDRFRQISGFFYDLDRRRQLKREGERSV